MGKITITYNSKYDVGDIVIFEKDKMLLVGIIDGYYVEDSLIWYNIRINNNRVFTYSNGGDIGEEDIVYKINAKTLKDEIFRLN